MLRIETGPSRWRRGTTEAEALRVWATGLRGDWIVRYDTGELAVWPDATFRRVWKPVTP